MINQTQLQDTDLIKRAHSYIEFLDSAGKADSSFQEKIPQICSRECKKIVNGKTRAETSIQLEEYMSKAQEIYGKWMIHKDYELFPSSTTRSITIKFIAETDKVKLIVFAILKFDDNGLIDTIDEVDNILEEKK